MPRICRNWFVARQKRTARFDKFIVHPRSLVDLSARVRAMPKTVPIIMRALLQRINRRLAANGEVLKAARTPKVAAAVCHYFVVRGNRVARERINPETLA